MANRDVFTLLTAPVTGTVQAMSPTDLRIVASAGELALTDYLRGIAAIGNLIVWADDNDNYTGHTNDLAALGAFLHHTAQMVNATRVFADHTQVMADMREELNASHKGGGRRMTGHAPMHPLFRRHRRQLLREESIRAETRRENAKANSGEESAKQPPPNMMGLQGLIALFGFNPEQLKKTNRRQKNIKKSCGQKAGFN